MNKYYAGIGSRQTPPEILAIMQKVAARLGVLGYILRSGRAPGADQAFETGCGTNPKEIFLPWPDFERVYAQTVLQPVTYTRPLKGSYEIAMKHHPAWNNLGNGSQKLQARNVHQILGHNLDKPAPSQFVVCWTPDRAEDATHTTKGTGGTGQAIRIATAYKVPVFNLKNSGALERLKTLILTPQEM